MATHSSILAWRNPWTDFLADYSPWGGKESDTTEHVHTHTHTHTHTHDENGFSYELHSEGRSRKIDDFLIKPDGKES